MDWSKLSPYELQEFLRLHGNLTTKNLQAEADKLFTSLLRSGKTNFGVTNPVADLYIASNLAITNPQKYDIRDIRQLTPDNQNQFANLFSISPDDPQKLERIIRILRFLNSLIEPDVFRYLPPEVDYQLALNTDVDSLQILCTTSRRFGKFCRSGKFWRDKAVTDLSITGLEYDQALKVVINPRETYIFLAANHGFPVKGVEKYVENNENLYYPMIFNAARKRKTDLVTSLTTTTVKGKTYYNPRIELALAGYFYQNNAEELKNIRPYVAPELYWSGILIGAYIGEDITTIDEATKYLTEHDITAALQVTSLLISLLPEELGD